MSTHINKLQEFYSELGDEELLNHVIKKEFANRIALISSFGADSVILLHLISKIDTSIPVLFLDTKKHFAETLSYVDTIKKRLHLTNIRFITPDLNLIHKTDTLGDLWNKQPDRCCWIRKVLPLRQELQKNEFDALITGRRRYQTIDRSDLQTIEQHEDGIMRINPLAHWTDSMVDNFLSEHNLPIHPLRDNGYLSIGCFPCTKKLDTPNQNRRAGRWAHTKTREEKKNECGIHLENLY